MSRLSKLNRFYVALILCGFLPLGFLSASAQQAPPTSAQPWKMDNTVLLHSQVTMSREKSREKTSELDLERVYTLADLIDLAEERNPQTRVAWAEAKRQAARLGVAKSELLPTLAAVGFLMNDSTVLFFHTFFTQNLFLFRPAIALSYTVLDFGERRANIDAQKASLLAANLRFNDTHRKVIFEMVNAYYRVMLALSRKDAAEVALFEAKTVQQSVEDRLAQGLATLPDKLDAQAATAKAEYELAAVQGEEDVARGELASQLRESPLIRLKLKSLEETAGMNAMTPDAHESIEEALRFRPDFLAKVQRISAAQAEMRKKRAAYFPKVMLSANYGHLLGMANQEHSAYQAGHVQVYQALVNFNWVLFDGGKRKNDLKEARADYEAAVAEWEEAKDQVEFQVWQAFVNLETSKKQLNAAESLLAASHKSYEAASESYHYGVRNVIDVTNAQRSLASARNTFVEARVRVLVNMAELAFQTGDLAHIGTPVPSTPPPSTPGNLASPPAGHAPNSPLLRSH